MKHDLKDQLRIENAWNWRRNGVFTTLKEAEYIIRGK